MIYDVEYETMPREALEAIQLRRLRTTLERVCATVPFYRERMAAAGIAPRDIQRLEDIRHIPFTTKQDLRDNYPFGMFAVPMDTVVRIHASSGTTGQPTVVGYTARDVNTWATLMARALVAGGASANDIIHNAYGYGLFTGGLGVHYGAEKLGASVIPVSGGNTKRQILIMRDFKPTVITATPSYTLHLAEVAEEMGVSFKDLSFKFGIFGAEPWSENMRQEIERKLNLTAVDIYGLSEVIGPGVAIECHEAKKGLHIFEDHFLPEIIDPATGEVLQPGQTGELVFTSLTKEAFPVIRYRTRDITSLNPEPCICGRTHVRMNRVSGRSDDMLIIHGVNVFPAQIEAVIAGSGLAAPHYRIVLDRLGHMDQATIMLEAPESFCTDSIKQSQRMIENVRIRLQTELGVPFEVRLVEPRTIERGDGARIMDRRKM